MKADARTFPAILLLALAAGALLAATCLPKAGPDLMVLTDHAVKKHVGLGLDVAAITAFIEFGKCNPVVIYSCPLKGVVKYICPVVEGKATDTDLWMGIIVGNATGPTQVITGFIAPKFRWDRAGIRDGCTSTVTYIPAVP